MSEFSENIFTNISEVLTYQDRPVLFMTNDGHSDCICTLLDNGKNTERWLVANLRNIDYQALKGRKIDLHDCFKNAEFLTILEYIDDKLACTHLIDSYSLSDKDLPSKGVYYEKDNQRDSE